MITTSILLSIVIYSLSLSFIWKLKTNYFDSESYINAIHTMNLLNKANGDTNYIKKYDNFYNLIRLATSNFISSLIVFSVLRDSTFCVSLSFVLNILVVILFGALLWSYINIFNSTHQRN